MELNRSLEWLTEPDETSCIKRRTNLEKCLIIALIIGGCGVLGFFINLLSGEDKLVCTTPSCILAESQILSQIDEGVDPCEDFYHFACGKLINETNEKHIPSYLLQSRVEKQLLNLLQEPIDENDHAAIKYEKRIFQGCINATEGAKSFETLQKMLHDISGWPVVMGGDWNDADFEWTELLRKLANNGLYTLSMFSVDIVFDKMKPSKKILRIDKPVVHVSEDKMELYKKMMTDVAIIFGAQSARANSDMTQVVEFMNELRKLHRDHASEYTRTTVEDFQKRNDFDWLNFINNILKPENKISGQDYVRFHNVELLDECFVLIKKTPKRTVANYMLWCAVEDLLPLLSNDLQDVHNDYQCLLGTLIRKRIDTCRFALKDHFSPLATQLMYAKKHLTTDVRKKTQEVYNRIKDEFLRLLKLSSWMSSKDKENAEHSFNTLVEVIGIKEENVDGSVFEKLFKWAVEPITHDNFLKIFLYHRSKFESMWIGYMLTDQQSGWVANLFYYFYISETTSAYLQDENMISNCAKPNVSVSHLLVFSMLHDLYYDEDKPMYMNYGTLGRNIGLALANIFIKLRKNARTNETWSEETEKGFSENTECLSVTVESVTAESYVDTNLEVAETTGLKLAHNAYKKWLKENGNEPELLSMNFEPLQLYWLSALSGLCFEDIDYGFNLFFDNKPILQNEGFAEDFYCTVDAKMNPSSRCNIF